MRPRDPVQRAADRATDLYDVATWDRRSTLDDVAVAVHEGIITGTRALVVAVAMLVLVGQVALVWVAASEEPTVAGYILLSVLPALALTIYIWSLDATVREPLGGLVVTFILGFLLAGFAAVLNSVLGGALSDIGARFGLPAVLLFPLFFFVVVGPVEETVKWAAVRLYAYRDAEFDAVVDGAVYGAVAGLGFATIENSLYIAQVYLQTASFQGPGVGQVAALASLPVLQVGLVETFETATVRSLAGPGHVIYSAFAGYYLGLAKFNPRNRGPIVVKGLLIAVLLHGTYNTAVTVLPGVADAIPQLAGLPYGYVFLGFVVLFDGTFGYLLYRKLARYRRYYRSTGAAAAAEGATDGDRGRADPDGVGRDEFE